MPVTTEKKGLFISGTGTGVGKSIIGSGLAKHLRSKGLDVGVMKPLETGVADPTQGGDDARLLAWAASATDQMAQINPYCFKTPAAPATASRLENRPVAYAELVAQGRALIARHDFTIIEGAGGLMVPVSGGFLIADLAKDLGLDVLVVADAALGTINRTLTTLTAARYLELQIAGYIINRMPQDPTAAETSAPHDLASLTFEELLAVIPEVTGDAHEQVDAVARLLPTLPSWPLLRTLFPEPQIGRLAADSSS